MRVAFVGKLQSGKSTAIKIFMEEFISRGVEIKLAKPLYDTQRIFTKEAKCRLFLQEMSDLAKKHFGADILSRVFEANLQELKAKDFYDFLCDDVRVLSDFETVMSLGFYTIGLVASDEVRKSRKPELFIGTDHITEIQIDSLVKKCDIVIENNDNDLEVFKGKLRDAYRKLLSGSF